MAGEVVPAPVQGPAPQQAMRDEAARGGVSSLRLYGALVLAGLRAKLNYRADFLLMAGTAVLMQALGYVFLWIVFRQIPSVLGWSFWELVVLCALVFFTEGMVSVFFEGLWRFNWLLHRGDFDVFLVRPVSPLLQLSTYDVGMNGVGNIVFGAAVLARALWHLELDWTLGKALIAVVLLASTVVVRASTVLAATSLGFWATAPHNNAMQVVHNLASFAQFPLSIYGRGLQALLTYGVPFAFISYYPAAWLFGKEHIGWIGLLTPLVAAAAMLGARALFERGIRRYEGAGN
jgi:ABC-2 type transport system permease protein